MVWFSLNGFVAEESRLHWLSCLSDSLELVHMMKCLQTDLRVRTVPTSSCGFITSPRYPAKLLHRLRTRSMGKHRTSPTVPDRIQLSVRWWLNFSANTEQRFCHCGCLSGFFDANETEQLLDNWLGLRRFHRDTSTLKHTRCSVRNLEFMESKVNNANHSRYSWKCAERRRTQKLTTPAVFASKTKSHRRRNVSQCVTWVSCSLENGCVRTVGC